MIKNLKLRSCCSSLIIPLSFDESMSYLEQLCAILKKLNDTIDQVNLNTEFIEEYRDLYDKVQQEIAEIKEEFKEYKEETTEYINNKLQGIKEEVITLINNEINILKLYVDNNVNDLQRQITDIETGKISVYDPTTGKLSPIQIVINNIYEIGRTDAITCQEFDDLLLSASEFDSKNINAIDFDTKGKSLLVA